MLLQDLACVYDGRQIQSWTDELDSHIDCEKDV